jgi:hypothetical protein
MHRDALKKDTTFENRYVKYWSQKTKDRLRSINEQGLCLNDDNELKIQEICYFFYTKMGRVELMAEGRLLSVDFAIPPECFMTE